MDDDYMFSEKQSIRESGRSLKKYGSTCCNHIRNNETLIRHDVEKTDTLQGIALKYGCTTEQIRRANRLFASDSLFLRQFLLVPVEKTSPYYPKPDENNSLQDNILSPTATTATATATAASSSLSITSMPEENSTATITSATTMTPSSSTPRFPDENNSRPFALPARPYSIAGELLMQTNSDDSTLNNHHHHHHHHHNHNNHHINNSSSNSKQSKSLDSVAAMTPDEENRKCINDFLNKIDNTILESRKYVEKSKEMLTSQSDDGLFITTDIVERRRNHLNNSYKNDKNQQNQHQRHSSTGSTSDTAQLLNTTQTRRVQNSLKRLEKQQDEFFEL